MSIDNVSGTSSNTGNVNGGKRAAGSSATETGQSVRAAATLAGRIPQAAGGPVEEPGPDVAATERRVHRPTGPVQHRGRRAVAEQEHGEHSLQLPVVAGPASLVAGGAQGHRGDRQVGGGHQGHLQGVPQPAGLQQQRMGQRLRRQGHRGQSHQPRPAGCRQRVSFMWDGKDSSGNIMPPGTPSSRRRPRSTARPTGSRPTCRPTSTASLLGQNGGELMLNLAGPASRCPK